MSQLVVQHEKNEAEHPMAYLKSCNSNNHSQPSQTLLGQRRLNLNDIILVSFLLALYRFHTLFWCSHYWLWTNTANWELWIQSLNINDNGKQTAQKMNKSLMENFIFCAVTKVKSGYEALHTSKVTLYSVIIEKTNQYHVIKFLKFCSDGLLFSFLVCKPCVSQYIDP